MANEQRDARKTRLTRARRTQPTPEDVLAQFQPRVRNLADELRALVRATIPTATEHAYPGWKAIGYRDPQCGYFCGIFPSVDDVRVGFEHGAELPDPDTLLTGHGKQVRYVVVRPGARVPVGGLTRLLRSAVRLGSV